MKTSTKLLVLSLIGASALYAASPSTINYQGYLTDASSNPIDANLSMTFKIYDVSTGGTALWTGTKTIEIINGVYSTVLGETTPFDLTTMKFDTQYYLGLNVNGDGEMSPRIKMTNVPYAQALKQVATADLNITHLDQNTSSDAMPMTMAEIKTMMKYWKENGEFTDAPPTLQTFTFNGFTYKDVYEPNTKRIWLDRNLGAAGPCSINSDTNSSCFGDYFQWGRAADGHEKSNSATTATIATNLTPGHGNFITDSNTTAPHPYWTSASLTTWDGTANDVCPAGYSIPTRTEWQTLTGATTIGFLKLPANGYRQNNGTMYTSDGYIHLSTLNGSQYDFVTVSTENASSAAGSAYGLAVRCIKDQ